MTAEQVAQMTFDAVRENRFYVFTHPQILPTVQARFEAALHGAAPADPFAGKPVGQAAVTRRMIGLYHGGAVRRSRQRDPAALRELRASAGGR